MRGREVIDSNEARPPEDHMAVLATVRGSIDDAHGDVDLAWLSLDDAPKTIAVEASYGDGLVFLSLPADQVQRLASSGLVVPVEHG